MGELGNGGYGGMMGGGYGGYGGYGMMGAANWNVGPQPGAAGFVAGTTASPRVIHDSRRPRLHVQPVDHHG